MELLRELNRSSSLLPVQTLRGTLHVVEALFEVGDAADGGLVQIEVAAGQVGDLEVPPKKLERFE